MSEHVEAAAPSTNDPGTEWLFERMAERRDQPALVWQDKVSSFGDLLARAQDWHAELERRKVVAGSVVLIEGGFSPNAVGLVLALVQRKAVIVPLTPLSRVHRPQFVELAQVQCSVLFDDQDQWTIVEEGHSVDNALLQKLTARGHPGLVIFSSGSTGKPKAVLHDMVALLGKFRKPSAPKSILTFLLFDHIGGMDTLFTSLSSGGTMVTTPSRDPDVVCRAIAAHRVHTLPASPTFLNLLLISEAYRNHDMSALRVIAYGTESMPTNVLQKLSEAFPGVKLAQTYGISELGVLRTRSRDDGSLWIKFKTDDFQVKVVDNVLWIRTPAAMMGYLNAPDLLDADGWLNTEDAVEVDGDYFRILGRVSELVNVGGQKVFPAEVENIISQMENVRDVAVYGERNPLTGQSLAARVNLLTPEPFDAFRKRLRAFCRERLPSYKIPTRVELTEQDQFGTRFKKMRRQSPEKPGESS
ncbi:MAG: fatty acid--CoA ligase family protein [Myxococcales bacterium]